MVKCLRTIKAKYNKQKIAMNKITETMHISFRKQTAKDLFFIFFGILLYSIGYTAFILPENVVMGGVPGVAALIYYAVKLPAAVTIVVANVVLLAIAFRALTPQFTIRTIIGVFIMSSLIGVFQPFFQQFPIITAGDDKFMHVLIGGAMAGAGLGLVFSHNGSTGGTDIIIALLNKCFSMSFGRAMQFIDITIISSSYLLFHSTETIVYGIAFTLIASYVCDYVVNGSRQTVQFLIISKEYKLIADQINQRMFRGVTLIEGKGWYSKSDVNILIVMTRKYESQYVFNLIKTIDPCALVSQSFCHGVFGKGFDKIK